MLKYLVKKHLTRHLAISQGVPGGKIRCYLKGIEDRIGIAPCFNRVGNAILTKPSNCFSSFRLDTIMKPMNRLCDGVGVMHSYPMNKFMGCSGAPYHQEATHGFNRGTENISSNPPTASNFNRGLRRLCS